MKSTSTTIRMKKIIIFSLVSLVVIVAGYFIALDFYVNGFEYRSKVDECGTDQLIVGADVPQDPTPRYRLPGEPNYRSPDAQAHYFCTEQEAKDAGYLPKYNEDGSVNEEYLPSKYE